MVGRRVCALPCFSLFLEMCWRWGGKKVLCSLRASSHPGGLPSAPKTGVLFSPIEHETRSAQMHGGCRPGNGNVGQSSRGYLWQDSGIFGMTICSQYCFHSTSLVFSLIFGPEMTFFDNPSHHWLSRPKLWSYLPQVEPS